MGGKPSELTPCLKKSSAHGASGSGSLWLGQQQPGPDNFSTRREASPNRRSPLRNFSPWSSRLLLSLCPFPFHHPSAVLEILGRFSNELVLPTIPLFASFPLHNPPHTSHKMQRALTSRARASLSSAAASKFRPGAGLSQQLRFAHKVCKAIGS